MHYEGKPIGKGDVSMCSVVQQVARARGRPGGDEFLIYIYMHPK
jgi:hypothetical protein